MSRNSDFSRLYKALGAEPGCSWDELRQAYRRQAQTWHPDRFPESSRERAEAEKRIVRINRAYQALASYWKQFGELPGQNLKKRAVDNAKRTPRKHTTRPRAASGSSIANRQRESHAERRVQHSEYQVLSLATLIVLCISVYGFLYWKSSHSLVGNPPTTLSRIKPPAHSEPLPRETVKLPRDDKAQIYFTIGSSMSKVNEIQGIPTRIEGNTWFYGSSKVHFVDGLVASWEISPSDPLYALQTYEPTSNQSLSGRGSGRIRKGSTKSEVRAIQGKPLFEYEDVWEYRISKIYFKNGKVVGWHNSPLDPLKVKN